MDMSREGNIEYCVTGSVVFIDANFHYNGTPISPTIHLEHLRTIGRAALMGCRMKFLNILRS